jgi:DNA-binding NtrC family response regulator
MQRLYRQISKVAASGISVFISGESGTGKELVAAAIHSAGPRAKGPLVPLNCGAIPESLQESELFGHEKGSFTGANSTRAGKFEQAQNGTIFLDEIAELSATSQVRLLRVIQERRLERVGGNRSVDLRIRVISATHRPLRQLVDTGRFREDLYYRLVVYPLRVPPLRERGEDIRLLAEHFLRKYESDYGPRTFSISDNALDVLRRYPWPGNVRELENVVHGAMVRADTETIEVLDLPPELRAVPVLQLMASKDPQDKRVATPSAPSARAVVIPLRRREVAPHSRPSLSNSRSAGSTSSSISVARKPAPSLFAPQRLPTSSPARTLTILDAEKKAISAAIEFSAGNLTQAAKRLGIGRATLYRKLARYGMRRS